MSLCSVKFISIKNLVTIILQKSDSLFKVSSCHELMLSSQMGNRLLEWLEYELDNNDATITNMTCFILLLLQEKSRKCVIMHAKFSSKF